MPTPAGDFTARIEFQRVVTARSALGVKAQVAWGSLGFARAKVRWGTSAERRTAAVEEASQAATFRCRSTVRTRGVTIEDRIEFAGRTYDVTGVAAIEDTPREIEFTAVASSG